MRRRAFIEGMAILTAWPLGARAQQPEQMRRVGVLMNAVADDPQGQAFVAAFRQTLQQLGWSDGRNVRMDIRWGANDVDLTRRYATELVGHCSASPVAFATFTVAWLNGCADLQKACVIKQTGQRADNTKGKVVATRIKALNNATA